MKNKFKITLGVIVLVAIIGIIFPSLMEERNTTASENMEQTRINPEEENINEKKDEIKEEEQKKEEERNAEAEKKAEEEKKRIEEEKKAEEMKKEEEQKKAQEEKKEVKEQETAKTVKKTIINGVLLVNKTYALPSNYNPGENSEAVAQLNKMAKAAREEIGKSIQSVSGFRSYDYQKNLFNRYAKKDGVEKASTYSARPGHSEHQTGLAFDIGGKDKSHWVKDSFANTEEAKWLKDNAHRFGYILRYPKGKTNITGYKYEPWHFRYIGVDHATKVYQNNVTLEEYLGVQ